MPGLLAMALAVFIAELGDKTQLATLLFATEGGYRPWQVFLASAGALVASSALAVAVGTLASEHLAMVPLKLIAGLGFIAIGAWTLWEYFSG